jgi:hypothetical protein
MDNRRRLHRKKISIACAPTSDSVSYDENDTRHRKLLRRIERFHRNVAIFASRLGKPCRQLTLPHAKGGKDVVVAIFN